VLAKASYVTVPEILILAAVLYMIFAPQPKKGKKPKAKRRPIPIRGNIRRRALHLRYRPPSVEEKAYAEKCRRENLRFPSPAMEAADAEFRQMGIGFEREVIFWYDGNCYFIVDGVARGLRLIVEADGQHHKFQQRYDAQRDKLLRQITGFEILREYNGWFLKQDLRGRLSARILEIDRLRRLGLT
jgi:very-short-patch-repair endonuclease